MIIKRYIFIIIILLLIIMFFLGSINVQAISLTDLEQQEQDRENRKEGLEDPTANPDSWKPILIDEPELKEKAGIILSIINIIGIVCSVIVIGSPTKLLTCPLKFSFCGKSFMEIFLELSTKEATHLS